MFRYFSYRMYPSKAQARRMDAALEVCRDFFNFLLADRLEVHRAGGSRGLRQQLRQVATFRRANPAAALVHSHTLQLVGKHVEQAWRAWVRCGQRGSGPRPREADDVRSFGYKQDRNGFRVKGRRLKLFQIGRVSVRWHRPLEGAVKGLRVARRGGRWFAAFCCEVEPAPLLMTGQEVGIDMGIKHLLTLSDGTRVENPRWALTEHERTASLWARVKRAVPGSTGHRKALARWNRLRVRVADRRRDYLCKVVADLVARFDYIAIEDLAIRNFGRHLAIQDAGWGLFRRLLLSKAEATGKIVALVEPRWTSQTCSACGWRNRWHLPLSERQFVCERCGLALDRDINAALNVLRLGRCRWGPRTDGPQTCQPVG